jgi:hypothetical protein
VRTKRTDKKGRTAITRTGAWKSVFLDALAKLGNVTSAMNAAKVDRPTVYRHRKIDQSFAAKWRSALREAGDVLEAEAWRRAVDGVTEPVAIAGQREEVQKYSDTLLIFLLKGNKPKKFRENLRHEVTGANGGAIKIEDLSKLPVEDLEKLRDIRLKLATAAPVSN